MGFMKKYDAVISGYTCVDLIPEFKKEGLSAGLSDLLTPGTLIEIDGLNFVPGGIVPNTGLAMRKFGKHIFLNGLVGDDFVGRIAKEWFGKYQVSDGIETTREAGTAFSIVIAPPGVDRIFLESPGCNRIFNTGNINFAAVSESRVFHFGYPPLLRQFYLEDGQQLEEVFTKVQDLGVVTSLDLSWPDPSSESGKVNWSAIMDKVLPHVDIFIPSLDEVLKIMMPDKFDEIESSGKGDILDMIPVNIIRQMGRQIIDSGVRILLIKAGHRGAYLLTGDITSINTKADLSMDEKQWNNCELWCSAYKADTALIKNSSGAGDTAAAAFLSAILNSQDPENSVRYAAMAGRNSLYTKNNSDDLGNWEELTHDIRMEGNELTYFNRE
jgi:sugar/nucleoside kinase (ribokinase family)